MALKKGLGMGLDALIPQSELNLEASGNVAYIDINDIVPNKVQPRKHFDVETLEELAESISKYGILQPIIVRKDEDLYEIVAGERRWRAARTAGLTEVPAIIKDFDELKTLEVALIENLQREDLNSIEEALTYKKLQDDFMLTQDEIAERVGKKRSTVANALRLLNLPERIQAMIVENRITAGHAKALLSVNDHTIQNEIADKIFQSDLSVRQTERLMKAITEQERQQTEVTVQSNAIFYKSVERDLNTLLGTKVKVTNGKDNRGKIEIEYFSVDDLNRLLELFKRLED